MKSRARHRQQAWWRLGCLLGLGLSLGGCAGPHQSPPAQHTAKDAQLGAPVDLAALLPLAEVLSEPARVDFGEAPARSHLGTGWSWDERSGDTTFVWSDGPRSELSFFLTAARSVELRLRCHTFVHAGEWVRQIDVAINGQPLPPLELPSGGGEMSLAIDSALARDGVNQLVFSYPRTFVPADLAASNDRRQLAWALDEMTLVGGQPAAAPRVDAKGRLWLGQGTAVSFFFDARHGGRLRLQGARRRSDDDAAGSLALGKLLVRWQPQSGEAQEVVVDGPNEIELAAARPARLTLLGTGPAKPTSGWWLEGLEFLATMPQGKPESELVTEPKPKTETETDAPAPQASRPDIFIFLVDTLRADALGSYGADPSVTPAIDGFAASATVYERAIAQSSWTKSSVASMLTGLRPSAHGIREPHHSLSEQLPWLPQQLAEAGYRTAAFVANAHITRESGFARGFETFEFAAVDTAQLLQRALAWLDEQPLAQPVLLLIHGMEPHAPYEPKEDLRRRFAGDVVDRHLGSVTHIRALGDKRAPATDQVVAQLRQLYRAEVAWVDEEFGKLNAALRLRQRFEPAAVLFLSDHGDAFREHQVFGHGWDLYGEVLRIPLMIKFPQQLEGRRVAVPVQHVDLLPTLFELAKPLAPADGAPADGRQMDGQSLLTEPLTRPQRPFDDLWPYVISALDYGGRSGIAVTTRRWKLIEPQSADFTVGGRELFDLQQDPAELDNVARQYPIIVGYLASIAQAEKLRGASFGPAAEVELDESTRQRLQALGYL